MLTAAGHSLHSRAELSNIGPVLIIELIYTYSHTLEATAIPVAE